MNKIKHPFGRPYGECAMCNKLGTIQYHHIIPKRFKLKTNIRAKLIWGSKEGLLFTKHKQRLEQLMIQVCPNCHKELHPENWKFHKNELILAEIREKKKNDKIL